MATTEYPDGENAPAGATAVIRYDPEGDALEAVVRRLIGECTDYDCASYNIDIGQIEVRVRKTRRWERLQPRHKRLIRSAWSNHVRVFKASQDKDKAGRWVKAPKLTMDDCEVALEQLAQESQRSPIADFLNTPNWDGKDRIADLLVAFFACDLSPELRPIMERFLIQMVARGLDPGCKADWMLVLGGPEGVNKSSFLRSLVADGLFTDDLALNDKEQARVYKTRGKLLTETPELKGMTERRIEDLKADVSRQEDLTALKWQDGDAYKRSYAQSATTNVQAPLLGDPDNQRRFVMVWCYGRNMDRDDMVRRMDNGLRQQIIAEAVFKYRRGDTHFIDPQSELGAALRVRGNARRNNEQFHLEGKLEEYISERLRDGYKGFTIDDFIHGKARYETGKNYHGETQYNLDHSILRDKSAIRRVLENVFDAKYNKIVLSNGQRRWGFRITDRVKARMEARETYAETPPSSTWFNWETDFHWDCPPPTPMPEPDGYPSKPPPPPAPAHSEPDGPPKPQFHPSSIHKPQWPEAFECRCGNVVEPVARPGHSGDCVLRCECGASRSQLLADAGNVKSLVKAPLFDAAGERSGHIECWRFDPAVTYTDKQGESHERKTMQSSWQGKRRGTALYREPASDDARVLIAEGEKACAAIADRTESDGVLCYGASSYARSIVLPEARLKGRECVLLPDNDIAGEKAVNGLGARLVEIGCTVKRTVHDQAAPQGHDAADMTDAELAAHLDTAAPFEPMDKPPERTPATQTQAPHANGYVSPQTMQARMVKLWDSCEVKDGNRNDGAYRFVRACLTLYEYQDVDWETFLWSRARDIGLPAVEVNGIIRSVRKTAVRETQAAFDAKKDEWKRSQP